MRKGTFWIEEKEEGTIWIGCEDYSVEVYGGMDYEWIYSLDRKNVLKMTRILAKTHEGSLKDMLIEEFGIYEDKTSMMQWFEENDIKYEFFSWVS